MDNQNNLFTKIAMILSIMSIVLSIVTITITVTNRMSHTERNIAYERNFEYPVRNFNEPFFNKPSQDYGNKSKRPSFPENQNNRNDWHDQSPRFNNSNEQQQ